MGITAVAAEPAATTGVVFRVRDELFAFPLAEVRFVRKLGRITPVPTSSCWVRGVVDTAEGLASALDFRRLVGQPSLADEIADLTQTLAAREQEHRDWLAELEACAFEARPFELALDPRQCAFGRWCETYQPANAVFAAFLKRFDRPHAEIHAIATRVEELVEGGNTNEALHLIQRTRIGALQALVGLFESAKRLFAETNREVELVLNGTPRPTTITCDEVLGLRRLDRSNTEDAQRLFRCMSSLPLEVWSLGKELQPVCLLHAGEIFDFAFGASQRECELDS